MTIVSSMTHRPICILSYCHYLFFCLIEVRYTRVAKSAFTHGRMDRLVITTISCLTWQLSRNFDKPTFKFRQTLYSQKIFRRECNILWKCSLIFVYNIAVR